MSLEKKDWILLAVRRNRISIKFGRHLVSTRSQALEVSRQVEHAEIRFTVSSKIVDDV